MPNNTRSPSLTVDSFLSPPGATGRTDAAPAVGASDDPAAALRGWTSRGGTGLPEAAVGAYVTSPAALLQILADRRRAVAIISADGQNYKGAWASWSGTGFLVAPNLLLTNHHVLNTADIAARAVVEFDFEVTPDRLDLDDLRYPVPKLRFALKPERLFVTSPLDGGLDYTFVWIEDAAARTCGSIPLKRHSYTIPQGDPAFVIHHPDGRPREVSLDDAEVLNALHPVVLHYSSDTMGGSSGSPVFDRSGRLIALHHASLETAELPLRDGGTTKVANEGIRISAITMDLEARLSQGGTDAGQIQEILMAIGGSDSRAGFFGARGRAADPAQPSVEVVTKSYAGTDQDIDIGFWNIEHLSSRYTDPVKLQGAAEAIADLTLDLWGLSEISPPAVEALVNRLKEVWQDDYGFACSEPDSRPGKQSTAMIWRTRFLKGEKVAWPESVEPMFHVRSDDPGVGPEAVHGKVFDRYPALYRFETIAPMPAYSFFVVPLHLKAMSEGSLRRRLAARILARAVAALRNTEPLDVILGGDMNAPLASGDFTALQQAEFDLLGATDEREGAFTYLKGPQSAIDNIFLTPSMQASVGKPDFFIVARDRVVPDYLAISDHRPVVMRFSLARSTAAPETAMSEPETPEALDALIDRKAATARSEMPPRITYAELKARIMDPDVPDAEIAPYLIPQEDGRRPFGPQFVPNPAMVEMSREGTFDVENALSWGNAVCRQRRQMRFENALSHGVKKPVLVSEGDSWFQFPFLIEDVIDQLGKDYLIWSLDAAGDTADNMVGRNAEYLKGLRRQKERVKAFLFSAAGNDVIGEENGVPVLTKLLKPYSPGRDAAWHVDSGALSAVLTRLEAAYRKVVATIRTEPGLEALPILIHGYDYAIPGGFPGDTRKVIYASQTEWLGGPLIEARITDTKLQRAIIRNLIDALYDMLARVAGDSRRTGVHLVDVRGTLKDNEWNDEIHATSPGFAKVAALFAKKLRSLGIQ